MDCFETRNELLGKRVAEALQKRFFDAYYVSKKEDVAKKVLELIPQNHTVSWGGSMTVDSLGIKQLLKEKGYTLIDRDTAKSADERKAIMRQSLSCGTFLMSSNAITEKGELFNIDGAGNRVAALCYGPDSVLIIAGINKIVPDMAAAYSKVRHYTSPINSVRLFNTDYTLPCTKTGECADCINKDSICAQFVETRICRPQGRIKVILVGEDLGI